MTDVHMPKRRQKLLWLTRNLPPLVGGMERFNERVLAELAREYDVAVCGPLGSVEGLAFASDVIEIPIRPLPRFLMCMSFEAPRLARRFKPDIVVAGSGLTAPFAWVASRQVGAKAFVFLYGLDLAVEHWLYRRLWLPFIRACDGAVAISRYTYDLAIRDGISKDRMRIVNPGIDFPTDNTVAPGAFRARYGLGDIPVLLSVGRLTRRKGLAEFVRAAFPSIVKKNPGTVLIIIGGEPIDALAGNRDGGAASIIAAAKSVGLESNIHLLGHVHDSEVNAAYIDCDVYVFPVIEIPGDVEGFGLVALEAAARGIPTVAFGVGGIPDAVREGVSGTLLKPGDYAGFAHAVKEYLQVPRTLSQREMCLKYAESCSWFAVGQRVRSAISDLSQASEAHDAQ